jgi:hypothetical protein
MSRDPRAEEAEYLEQVREERRRHEEVFGHERRKDARAIYLLVREASGRLRHIEIGLSHLEFTVWALASLIGADRASFRRLDIKANSDFAHHGKYQDPRFRCDCEELIKRSTPCHKFEQVRDSGVYFVDKFEPTESFEVFGVHLAG